jgi:hypothetical protein
VLPVLEKRLSSIDQSDKAEKLAGITSVRESADPTRVRLGQHHRKLEARHIHMLAIGKSTNLNRHLGDALMRQTHSRKGGTIGTASEPRCDSSKR